MSEALRFTGSNMSPGDFLDSFCQAVPEASRVSEMEYYLKSGSEAREWFEQLPAASKPDWPTLKAAFKAEFSGVPVVKKSGAELERELCAMRLPEDDVGVYNEATNAYKHNEFAYRLLRKAKDAKIDAGRSSITTVRDNLPDILRSKIPDDASNWKDFTDAIAGVDMAHIREAKRAREEEKKRQDQFEAKMMAHIPKSMPTRTPDTPTKGATAALANMRVSTGSGQRPSSAPLFQPRCVMPLAEAQAIAALMNAQRVPANSDEHKTQLTAWRSTHGNDAVPFSTVSFPLSPGTARPGSRECWKCGLMHEVGMGRPCTGHPLPGHETTWRELCGLASMTIRRNGQSVRDVRAVFYEEAHELASDPDYAWAFGGSPSENREGNASGSFD